MGDKGTQPRPTRSYTSSVYLSVGKLFPAANLGGGVDPHLLAENLLYAINFLVINVVVKHIKKHLKGPTFAAPLLKSSVPDADFLISVLLNFNSL